jgi:hypothetical protein
MLNEKEYLPFSTPFTDEESAAILVCKIPGGRQLLVAATLAAYMDQSWLHKLLIAALKTTGQGFITEAVKGSTF